MAIEHDVINIKDLRKSVDQEIQKLKLLAPSRERALSITKLQEAVMWLGMDLKRISEENPGKFENPYPHSKDSSTTIIDKTADNLKL